MYLPSSRKRSRPQSPDVKQPLDFFRNSGAVSPASIPADVEAELPDDMQAAYAYMKALQEKDAVGFDSGGSTQDYGSGDSTQDYGYGDSTHDYGSCDSPPSLHYPADDEWHPPLRWPSACSRR